MYLVRTMQGKPKRFTDIKEALAFYRLNNGEYKTLERERLLSVVAGVNYAGQAEPATVTNKGKERKYMNQYFKKVIKPLNDELKKDLRIKTIIVKDESEPNKLVLMDRDYEPGKELVLVPNEWDERPF